MPKKIRTIDILIYIIPVLLLSIGVSLIYSLVFTSEDAGIAQKQLFIGILSIISMLIFSYLNYKSLKNLWWIFYGTSIVLLVYVDLFGKVSGGAMRWIDVGIVQIQPSEIAKLGIIISLAAFFADKRGKIVFKDLILSLLFFAVPALLILKEPDLGTAIVVFFIYLGVIFASKPSRNEKIVIVSMLSIMVMVFVLATMDIKPFGSLLHDYQRKRVLTFINPEREPLKAGYNVIQAQIAIGSGGIFGKGLGRGSQSQLEYLPKPYSDFIFAGAGEALGFLGTSLIIVLELILVIRIYSIGQITQDGFGVLICSGVAAMFLSQSVINIGMNLGLAPVTGIPLPFMSAGGTALLICFIALGIVQSVYIRHKRLSFS